MTQVVYIILGVAFLISARLGGVVMLLLGLTGGGLDKVWPWLKSILDRLLSL